MSFRGSSAKPTPKGPVLRLRVVRNLHFIINHNLKMDFTNHLVSQISFSPLHVGELSRKLEEREAMVSQLQRAKNSFSQNVEELKKQLEEDNKVSSLSLHHSVVVIYKAGRYFY